MSFALPPNDMADPDAEVDRLFALPAAVVWYAIGGYIGVTYCIDGGDMNGAFATARRTAADMMPGFELLSLAVKVGGLEHYDL